MARRRKSPAASTEDVILQDWHEHRSVHWPPGHRLTLRPDQAQRLYARGIAVPAQIAVPEQVHTTPPDPESDDGGQ